MITKERMVVPIVNLLLVFIILLFPLKFLGQNIDDDNEFGSTTLSMLELDQLMQNKSIENCEKAIKGFELLLLKDPNNYDLLYKTANAYIAIIDIKTSALLDEKEEYKPILKKMGKKANEYAKRAIKIRPNGKEGLSSAIVSYGYYSASFGIFKAIFKGAAGHYKELCNRLIAIAPDHLGALGYRSLGKLYQVAPWPVGSKKKALKFFKKSLEIDNSVLFSHFFVGFLYFNKDKYDMAEKEFKYVIHQEPHPSERHFINAYKNRAREFIEKIKKKRNK